jgi:diguanylate cyclase (GGDEF)-like protein
MRPHVNPLTLGLRFRLMLTLAAVAVFPIAGVSYAVIRSEVGSVTRGIDYELHDAAVTAQSRFSQLLGRRELAAVAAASSPQMQKALDRHEGGALERFADGHGVLLEVAGHRYGTPLANAAHARVQLVRGGRDIGWVVAQVPLDAATLRQIGTPSAHDVHLSFVNLRGPRPARGATLRLTSGTGINAVLPSSAESARTGNAYRRVGAAGLLGLLALMFLTFLLARPLLRAIQWTEARASEARVDALTGLSNRRALEESLGAEISRAERFGQPLALVLLDLDRFKQTNDSYGHAGGDLVLRAVSRLLWKTARQGDTVARFGGEEFVAVLPQTNLDGARRFAERLRRAIEARSVGEIRTTASFGVAAYVVGDDVASLLAAADEALYLAKERGRNRVESAAADRPPPPAESTTAAA